MPGHATSVTKYLRDQPGKVAFLIRTGASCRPRQSNRLPWLLLFLLFVTRRRPHPNFDFAVLNQLAEGSVSFIARLVAPSHGPADHVNHLDEVVFLGIISSGALNARLSVDETSLLLEVAT